MTVPFARLGFAIAFLAVGGYSVMALRGPKGMPALLEKNRQIEIMEKRNAVLAREIEHKRERIKRLEDNPAEQEMEIRHRLKLVHPGEKVYIVDKK